MRVASPLLYDLARGVDVDRIHSGERVMEIPPVVFPHVELPLAQLDTLIFQAAVAQRSSFFTHATVIRTNQADSLQSVATFGQGVWYISLDLWYVSTFSDFTAEGNGVTVTIGANAATQRPLLLIEPVANVHQRRQLAFRALFPEEGWLLQLFHLATGVGETGHAKLAVWASKLL